jgi:hypothetical protein
MSECWSNEETRSESDRHAGVTRLICNSMGWRNMGRLRMAAMSDQSKLSGDVDRPEKNRKEMWRVSRTGEVCCMDLKKCSNETRKGKSALSQFTARIERKTMWSRRDSRICENKSGFKVTESSWQANTIPSEFLFQVVWNGNLTHNHRA